MTELGQQPTYPRSAPPESTSPHDSGPSFDPLRYCIFTTIALLAWAVGPAPVAMVMSALGLLAYGRAWRGGLRQSRCALGDVRLVVAYLAAAFIASGAVTTITLLRLFR